MADVNGDGWLDLFVGGFENRPASEYAVRGATGPTPERLLLGGAHGFTNDAGFPGVEARTSGATFADLDGDGRPDLVVARNVVQRAKKQTDISTVPTAVYRNEGEGRFTKVATLVPDRAARAVAVLDVNGDGRPDLFVGEDGNSASSALLRNDGDFRFTDITSDSGIPSDLTGYGVGAADLTGDGRTDLVIAGSNRVFVATGNGHFRDATPTGFAWTTYGDEDIVTGVAIADLDRDGRPDVVMGHHFGSTLKGERVPVRVFLDRGVDGSGDPKLEDVTASAGVPGFATKAPHVQIADFDNDGWPDLLVTASASDGGRPVVLRNRGVRDGVPRFDTPAGLGDAQYWITGAVADVDHDGRLDAFVAEWYPTKPSLLLHNTGGSGHWLGVDLSGLPMGGVGATVAVYEAGRAGDAGALLGDAPVMLSTGYAAGAPPILHFGLGDATAADIVVHDGTGTSTTLKAVTADRMIRPGTC
jgi:hypothetical protein